MIVEFDDFNQQRVGEATVEDKVQDEMTMAALSSAWSNRDNILSSMWDNRESISASVTGSPGTQ